MNLQELMEEITKASKWAKVYQVTMNEAMHAELVKECSKEIFGQKPTKVGRISELMGIQVVIHALMPDRCFVFFDAQGEVIGVWNPTLNDEEA